MAYQSKYTGLQIDDILDSVEWKQGKIEDLASIRAGAQKGATAIQSVKTINGQSIVGSGDIEISGGEANVQSDWLENDLTSDAYIRNKTHNLEGLTITKAGNYSVSTNNNRVYFAGTKKIYTLSIGVRTQIYDGPPIYVTLDGAGILIVEDIGNYIAMHPLVSISSITPLDDMFIPETIARTSELKTINGESIVGSGDLTIEGGAQSMVSTTWAELKDMRDSASLVAGTWYRITDYVTTTSQQGTRSLEHPFDVVVLATGENTLSEEARAVRHEGDISMSVSILGMKFFYKGVLIVDGVEWFEFENPEGSLVTSSATPAIGDIVYPYFDGTIVTDEVFPIESVGESENEYFLNNKANLDAWKIWYCLDNDKKRFPWVVAKTKKSIVVTLDEATLLTAKYNGTYEYEGIMYYRWDTVYSGMNVSFLTISDNPKAGDTTSVYGIIEMDMFIPADIPIIGVNEPSENEGFGVIYRMIDERSNDCPYDFKNIQFLVPITHGQFSENGTEEWVFTFNLNSGDGSASTDYSNTSYCFNNIIKSALLGLNFNIFLNNAVMIQCYNNTLGNGCMHNVFNDGCYNNTLGNECMYNLFERYTCRCNVSPNVQSETIANNFGYTTEARVAYDSSNTLKIYCEADDIDYNDLRNKPTIPTIDTSMSSSSTNAVQNKVVKSYVDSVCNIPIETTTSSAKSLTANIYYKWTNTPTSITITLTTPTNANILNNYMFEFTASSSGCTLSVPSSIKWLNEIPPVIEPGKTYQISIINNLATVAKFG